MTNELLKAKALSAHILFDSKKKETIYKPTRGQRLYIMFMNNLKNKNK